MRILLRALALIVAAGVLFLPALFALVPSTETTTGPDPVRISDYTADYVVTADGDLVAKEQITTEFPGGRHGIFRFWDLTDPSDSHVRLVPEDVTVRLDGSSVPFDLQWQKGRHFRVAKIGDPDSFVSPGTHVYTITYRIDGALAPSTAGPGTFASSSWTDEQPAESVFYWNVVAQGWQMDIDRSTVHITLPTASGKVQCTSSFDGSGTCDISGAGTDQVTVTTGHLSPRTPVTVRIGLPIKTPDRVTAPWPVAADRALGRSAGTLGIIVLTTLGALLVGYYLDRRSRERPPGYPVMYEPPPGLGPVQTAYMTTETVPRRGLVATLLYQAEQGLTTLTDNGGKSWTITGVGDADAWAKTDDITRFVGEALSVTQPGSHFKSSPDSVASGQTLQSVRNALAGQTSGWAADIGAQRTAGMEILARVAVAAAGLLFLAVGIFFHPPVSMYLLPWPDSSSAVSDSGAQVSVGGVRRSAATCGHVPVASSGCCRPIRPRTASTSAARRSSTPRSSRTPSRSTAPIVGPGSTSSRRAPSRPCRSGTAVARRRPRARASSATTTHSPDSNPHWPRPSAPTRPPSPRHPQVVAGAAVAEGAVVEAAVGGSW